MKNAFLLAQVLVLTLLVPDPDPTTHGPLNTAKIKP